MSVSFVCSICGQTHEGFPAMTFRAPAAWDRASEEERDADWKLNSDFCRFRDVDFHVRAVLELPITGSDQTLEFGVWSRLSRANFDRYRASFEDEDQSRLGPLPGLLSNTVRGYPETVGLECRLLLQDGGQRPLLELASTDHPLAIQQRHGITLDEAALFYHTHWVR